MSSISILSSSNKKHVIISNEIKLRNHKNLIKLSLTMEESRVQDVSLMHITALSPNTDITIRLSREDEGRLLAYLNARQITREKMR